MIRKLRVKFVVINMAMVSIMLCIIFGLVYNSTRHNLETESINMMQGIATRPIELDRPDIPNEQLPELKLPYFSIALNKEGEVIATGGGYYDLSDEEFLKTLVAEANATQQVGVLDERGLRFYRADTPMGATLVFADMSSETRTLTSLVKTSLLIAVLSFLGFLVISIFLSRWAVKPVAAAWRRQKQFIADASHELKTPLTVILTNAELLQSEGYTPAERNNFSQSILLMGQQMKLLVEKMLELARSDTEQSAPTMQPVDLSKLVLDSAISFEGVFVDKGLLLESQIEPDITVQGNGQALQQLVDILLDNAQKYSAPSGVTTVQLSSCGQTKCRLQVSNPGAAIPPEDLKKIFQRFYRMDKARSRDGSFGLGLSVAESIVAQHKGKIWAESQNGMNTFIAELPKKA